MTANVFETHYSIVFVPDFYRFLRKGKYNTIHTSFKQRINFLIY
jgi:hypothetical protein